MSNYKKKREIDRKGEKVKKEAFPKLQFLGNARNTYFFLVSPFLLRLIRLRG
jgi:hypothetical protein